MSPSADPDARSRKLTSKQNYLTGTRARKTAWLEQTKLKMLTTPEVGRARLKAKIEAARRASPIVPISDDEFRNDVIEAREEYRELLRQGLAPVPTEPDHW